MSLMTDDAFTRFVQRALIERGAQIAEDGKPGPATRAALLELLGPAPERPAPQGWDARSARNLVGVHPDLVRIMERARDDAPVPFVVIEGLRTVARQKELVRIGASQTMRSRHLTGHAVDIAPLDSKGQIAWDWPLFDRLAPAVKQAANSLGLKVEWGGDWKWRDGPHWQLPWGAYP